MTEEEKKDIKILKEDIGVYIEKGVWKENSIFVKSLKNVLNLSEKKQEKIEKTIKYIKEKQKIQYKYALSQIECDELLKILEGE